MTVVFAHPVLASWTADYREVYEFSVEASLGASPSLRDDEFSLNLNYTLVSSVLNELRENGSAAFGSLIASPYTMVRRFYWHKGTEASIVAKFSDFSTDILLTPYLVATEDIRLDISEEHDDEFSELGADGFDISKGAILAIGDGVKVSTETAVSSIVEIVGSSEVAPGRFALDYEDSRIKVFVSDKELSAVDTMRGGSDLARRDLFPSVYLPAISGALRNLSSHSDRAWAPAIRAALERNGYGDADEEKLSIDADHIAQRLMDNPLGMMARKRFLYRLTQEAYDTLRRVSSEQPDLWFDPETDFESVLKREGVLRYRQRSDIDIVYPIEMTVDKSKGRRPNQADEQAFDFHQALSGMTPRDATDPLVWGWVSHFLLHSYCIDRWPLRGDATKHVQDHYFLSNMSMGLYQLNVGSRTWWIAEVAQRAARASKGAYSPKDLVSYFANHAQHYHTIVMRAFLRNELVLSELCRLLLYEAQGISNEGLRELWRRLNFRAAGILLESLSRDRLRQMMVELSEEIMSVPEFVSDRSKLRNRQGVVKVLSLGAGVQSSAMALMADRGEYGLEKPDIAIFADTGWEPPAVYEHLDWLESQLSYEVVRVSAGNIRDDILKGIAPDGHKFLGIPAYTVNPDGSKGTLIRQCTEDYKLKPIYSHLRKLLGLEPGRRAPKDKGVEMWLGISVDEVARQKDSRFEWVELRYPLIDRGFSRVQLLDWFERNYPGRVLPRSACIGCPYHSDAAWKDMILNDRDSFDDAVFVDSALRESPRTRGAVKGKAFLHARRVPLGDIDFSEATGYRDLMMSECEGLCGI